MRTVFFVMVVLFLGWSCETSRVGAGELSKSYQFFSMPGYRLPDNKLVYLVDSGTIAYYKDYRLLELPYRATHEINNVLVSDTILFSLLVYREGADSGFYLKDQRGEDSFRRVSLQRLWLDRGQQFIYKPDFVVNGILLNKKPDSVIRGSEDIQEKYLAAHPDYDSVVCFFSKRNNFLRHSLSTVKDRQYGAKLSRVVCYLRRDFKFPNGDLVPLREITMRMGEAPVLNKKETIHLIEKFMLLEKSFVNRKVPARP